jgi:hypothetical protein
MLAHRPNTLARLVWRATAITSVSPGSTIVRAAAWTLGRTLPTVVGAARFAQPATALQCARPETALCVAQADSARAVRTV